MRRRTYPASETTKQRVTNQVKLMGFRYRKGSYKSRKAGIMPIRMKVDYDRFSHRVFGDVSDMTTPMQIKFNKVCCDTYKKIEGAANPDAYHHWAAPRKRKR
jgi:hypothetical protein